jgi:predicted Zn-dependent peptidase
MREIEGRGGQFNAFTSREYTCIYVKMLAEHVHVGLDILADVVRNATFNDLEKERNVILEEIASIEDTPDEYAHDLIALQHWPDHPLGRPVSGSHDSVSGLGLDDVRAFHTRWYQPGNMVVSVAGRFDEDAVFTQIEGLFGDMAAGPDSVRVGPPAFAAGMRHVPRDIAQSHICCCFPGVPVNAHERYAAEMLSSVLGGGSTSRLFERIREDEGLAYAIYSYQAAFLSAGVFGVYAAVAPQNLKRTLALVSAELRRLRDEPVPESELTLNREQIKGGLLMALENTFTRMSRMAKSMFYYGRILSVEELITALESVTAEDIQEMAGRMFATEQCALLVLGPAGRGGIEEGVSL